ncbi:MAG: polyphosphate polymerase domain-containing protein [Clostridiales bacterium]|nr:polyphosphate polymerase domain-containing protein [Clostridiales bacterium]
MQAYTSTFERSEKKYLLSVGQYGQLINVLQEYTLPDAYGNTDIYTIYYDTPDFLLVRRSIEKPVFKEKLRLRTYGRPEDHDTAYIEMKRKYNKTVYKRRIAMPYREALEFLRTPENDSQIAREIGYMLDFYPQIQPAISMTYSRISLIGQEDPNLRITFDSNVRWRTNPIDLAIPAAGTPLLEDGWKIMELKFVGALPLWLVRLLSEVSCFPVPFSKYGKAYEAMLNSTI